MEWRRWRYAFQARLRVLLRTRRNDDDLDDELAFHLAMETEENLRRGMSRPEAARRARLSLGGVEQTKEASRDVRPLHGLQEFARDVRYAFRLIRRAPGFATVAVLTIALGVGANAAIFGVVNGILLRPLPYAEPDRLVRVYLANPAQGILDGPLSVPDIDDWRARTRALASLAGSLSLPVILTGQGDPAELQAAFVAGDFFGTLGTSARLGRPLLESDLRQGLPNVVISERLWTSRFGRRADVLGTSIALDSRSYRVVGIMPAAFRFPDPATDVWVPQATLPDDWIGPRVRSRRAFEAVARLAPGVEFEEAQQDLRRIASQLASEFPATNEGWNSARAVPLRTVIVGEVDTALGAVAAVAGLILLIACANIANLQLARGMARSHELATRVALGAGRMRIAGQLMTESLVLGLIGGVAGLALSFWSVQPLLALSAGTLPRVEDVQIDGRVLAFGALLAFITVILSGIVPALHAANADPRQRLAGGRGTVGGGRRLQNALVVAQVGLAIVLVIGAVLMSRSFLRLSRVDPGFDPERTLAVTIHFNLASASGPLARHLVQRQEELLERIAALPGVVEAGSITALPLEAECRDRLEFVKPGSTAGDEGAMLRAPNCNISPGYLRAMRIPLIRGRPLPDDLTPGAPLPFLVSEAAARRFWPGQDPVGQVVRANYGNVVVVGVVGDVRHHGLASDPPPVVYFNQKTAPRILATFVVRAAGDPLQLAAPIRDVVRELDPNQPIRTISTLEDVLAESIARDRFFTLLFGLFGALALALAAVGVYGVLSYSVGHRTREIGVRMTLGARQRDVLGMVLLEGLRLVLTGVALGAVSSLWLTQALASELHGISTTDPATFVLAPVTLIAVALAACYVPARRATRVEPVTALRAE